LSGRGERCRSERNRANAQRQIEGLGMLASVVGRADLPPPKPDAACLPEMIAGRTAIERAICAD
jgi:hypothetical protein